MKNETMRLFPYSIKLAKNKETSKTFLSRYTKTFFFYIDNKYQKTKHIKRKNDKNQV